MTVIWQGVSVEELVKRRLGGTGESNNVDQGRKVDWVGRRENQEWIVR